MRRAVWEGYRHGRAASWLHAEDIETLFAEPLDAARKRLNIAAPLAYEEAQRQFSAMAAVVGITLPFDPDEIDWFTPASEVTTLVDVRAYAGVKPVKFSVLNLISAFAWAGAIMLFVKGGSTTLNAFGLNAWWGPFIPAILVIAFFRWLGTRTRT